MNANERQVAGTHYEADYQHWDFVVDAKLGYFEGQITKYVSRCYKKNGLQDVDKALHFADKAYELAMQGKIERKAGIVHITDMVMILNRYRDAQKLNALQDLVVCAVAYWCNPRDLRDVRNFVIALRDDLVRRAHRPTQPMYDPMTCDLWVAQSQTAATPTRTEHGQQD